MAKAYYRVGDFHQEVLNKRKETFGRGYDIGFHSAYWNISLKRKSSSYIYAHPFTGKTSFIFDIYMHIARTQLKKGEVISIYSPEAGDRVALTSYLVQVYLGKKLHGKNSQEASDDEWLEAMRFIHSRFILLDPDLVGDNKVLFSAKEMFRQIAEAEKEYKVKSVIALIDPYNLLSREVEDRGKAVAEYTLENLYYIEAVAKSMDMHIQIATHLRDEDTVVDKDTGVEYMNKPYPSKVAQGQSWWRVGKIMIGLWRCPAGVHEKETGFPYPENATDILIQKNKVLGAGEVGKFRLYFDNEKQKFYEIIEGKKYYCGEYDKYMKNVEDSLTKNNVSESIEANPRAGMQPNKEFEKSIF